MTTNVSFLTKAIIGPGHALEDSNPLPQMFRQTSPVGAGVQHATPTGAIQPTGSQAGKTPQPE